MNVKRILWHMFPECGMDQLASGKMVLNICKAIFRPEFFQFVHRSNPVTIPADDRLVTNSTHPYPQEWHFKWKDWTQALLIVPTGFGPTRFTICTYSPATRTLNACDEMRRISDGPFAMQLTGHDQYLFTIGERQIALRSGGIYGGLEEGARHLSEQTDMY